MTTKKSRKGKKTATAAVDNTPDVAAPENGNGNGSYGNVSAETLSAITMMRSRTEAMIAEIGRMELRKSRLIDQVEELDQAASRMLRQEAEAMGIPNDKPWRMTPEGEAVVMSEGA